MICKVCYHKCKRAKTGICVKCFRLAVESAIEHRRQRQASRTQHQCNLGQLSIRQQN